MQRLLILLVIYIWQHPVLWSQNYTMNGTAIQDCNGSFFDPGGPTGTYGNNQSFTTTICSDGGVGGTHIRLDFSGIQLGDGDLLCFYDGTSTAAPLLSCSNQYPPGSPFVIQATAVNPSGCLTVVFTSDGADVDQGWSASISCVASCQQVLADLVLTIPAAVPADTGWIDICPGKRVNFSGIGVYPQNNFAYSQSDLTTTFEWSFGDGSIAYGPEVSHVFAEEGGYYVQLALLDSKGCKNTNLINQRIRVAPRPNFGIANTFDNTICSGDTVQLSASVGATSTNENLAISPEIGSFSVAGTRSDSLALPDGTGIGYETSLYFTEFSPGQTLTNINDLLGICVNMEHSYLRDLQIKISCPNGTEVILHNHAGQTGGPVFLGIPNDNDNFFPIPGIGADYCWTPNAVRPTWLTYANTNLPGGSGTLPTGDYSSFQPLSNLVGCPLNGEWTITVTDLWPIDNGYIFNWGINFNTLLYPDIETFSPTLTNWEWKEQSSIFYADMDSIAAAPQNAGSVNYVFTLMDSFGCTWDTTLRVNVLPFTHPDCFSCRNEYTPLSDTSVCVGVPATLNGAALTGNSQEIRFETSPEYPIGAATHPHNNPYIAPIGINSLGFATLTNPTAQIESICVDLETDFDSDINLFLRSPDNKILELSTGNGGSGDNYKTTCFSPTATTPITAGVAPFDGTFRPEGNWTALNNAQINGDWKLYVSDGFGLSNIGKLKSWTIAFNTPNIITYTWTPSTGLSCTNCPNPIATPSATTTYIMTAQDNFNCQYKDTATVNIVNFFPAPALLEIADMQNGNMTWQWTAVSGVSAYQIQVNNGSWQTVNNTIFTITGLIPGQVIDFRVRALGGSVSCPPQIVAQQQTYFECLLVANLDATFPCTCPGDENGAVLVTTTGGQGVSIFYASYGSPLPYTTGNLTFFPAGTHRVWAVDGAGCKDTVEFLITEPDQFMLNITEIPVLCFGGNSGSLQVTGTGGTGVLDYDWQRCTGGTITEGTSAVNLTAGCYRVTVTDQIGCTSTSTATVTENPPFSFTTSQTAVTCFGANNGEASITVTGGVPPYSYLWDNGYTGTLSISRPGGFGSVTVTDNVGCEAVTLVQVLEPQPLLIDSIRQVAVRCAGNANGQLTAFVKGGVTPYQYKWSGTTQTTPTITNLIAGTYTLTLTDANGCTAVRQVQVGSPAPLSLVLSSTFPELCVDSCNGSATWQASGGTGPYLLDWGTNGLMTNVLSSSSLCPGNYQAILSDAQGCKDTSNYSIVAATTLTIQLQNTAPTCVGSTNGSILALGSGGNQPFSYVWSNGATTASAPNLNCGSYAVTLTNDNNCKISTNTMLICPDSLVLDSVRVVSVQCFGEANGSIRVFPSGGSGVFTYQWSDVNQQISSQLSNVPAGTYTVTISDGSACTLIRSFTIQQPTPIALTTTMKDIICVGESNGNIQTVVSGGTPGYTYVWSTGATSSEINGLTVGDYTVTITDSKGCTRTTPPIAINQPAVPVSIAFGQIATACFETNNGLVSAQASGSNGAPFSYIWNNGQTTATLQNVESGNYVVTATDAKGCTTQQTVFVPSFDSITINMALVAPTCFGDINGQAGINFASGGGGNNILTNYTFQWSLPGNPVGDYVGNIAGGTAFMVTVTDKIVGCSRVLSYTMGQPVPLIPELKITDVRCFGEKNGAVLVSNVTGGIPVSYTWSSGDATPLSSDLPKGTYTVTITDSKGCTGTGVGVVNEPPLLTLSFDPKNLLCNGDTNGSVVANALGGTLPYSFVWSTGNTSNAISDVRAGQYILTLTDQNGCTLVQTATITQPDPLNVSLNPEDPLCNNTATGRVEVLVSGGVGPYRYALNSDNFVGTSTFLALRDGQYQVRIRDAKGCITRDSFVLIEPQPLTVAVSPVDATITFGDQLTLTASTSNASGQVSYVWRTEVLDSFECVIEPACFSIQLQPNFSNTVYVVATDENGCTGSGSARYTLDKPRGIYVPTGFTPNNDSGNDLLNVFGKAQQVRIIKNFRVFDRWGELIFEDTDFAPNDLTRGWDGTFRGQKCLPGVYVWTIEAEYNDGFQESLFGQTTLIR